MLNKILMDTKLKADTYKHIYIIKIYILNNKI